MLMNPQVWVASGHVGGFSDPLMDCRDCHARHRADKLIEDAGGHAEGMSFDEMTAYIREHGIACPECGSKNFKMCIRDRDPQLSFNGPVSLPPVISPRSFQLNHSPTVRAACKNRQGTAFLQAACLYRESQTCLLYTSRCV